MRQDFVVFDFFILFAYGNFEATTVKRWIIIIVIFVFYRFLILYLTILSFVELSGRFVRYFEIILPIIPFVQFIVFCPLLNQELFCQCSVIEGGEPCRDRGVGDNIQAG